MGETPFTITLHGLTLGAVVIILGLILKEHKTYTHIKERVNQLWYHHCVKSGDKYESVDNGRK